MKGESFGLGRDLGAPNSNEPLVSLNELHQFKSVFRNQIDKDGDLTNLLGNLQFISDPASENSIKDKVRPVTDAIVDYKGISLDRLKNTKDLITKSASFRESIPQGNVFRLMDHPRTGILAQLKNSNRIGPDWELYPTEPGSPADKIGADILLVNTKTGKFFILDPTQREAKGNVFNLRRNGVILFDNNYFDRGGALKQVDPDNPQDIETRAQEFRLQLSKQIENLTKSEPDFKLGETPLPDIQRSTPEATQWQITKLIEWAKARALQTGERGRGKFTNMAETLERGAGTFEKLSQLEKASPALGVRAKQIAQQEIANFALSKWRKSSYKEVEAKTKSEVYYHDGNVMLKTKDGAELHNGGNLQKTVMSAYTELLAEGRLLATLTNKQLREIGFDVTKIDTLNGQQRLSALERLVKTDATTKRLEGDLRNYLISERTQLEAIDKNSPITKNIVKRLAASDEDTNLRRTVAPPPLVADSQSKPIELQMPLAARDLKALIGDNVTQDSIREAFDMLIDDPASTSKWSKGELEAFKKLAESYRTGDVQAVKRVRDFFKLSEVQDPTRPKLEAGKMVAESSVKRVPNGDGTSTILDQENPISKLGWKERLTDEELRGMLEGKKLLEDRQKNGDLTPEEKKTLEALKFIEHNINNKKVHDAVLRNVEAMRFARPEGGFKVGQVVGSVTAVSILLIAALGAYLSSQDGGHKQPLQRARFGGT
ncbi:MAG: hypothetical protein K2X93_23835 [Candidatus Obscuribacterales bacterium]|nr:hypothetical protein [Candidatus Obscuribacterales bacterium]